MQITNCTYPIRFSLLYKKHWELKYPSTKCRGEILLCVVKQIVIAQEDGAERGSEILTKFYCLGDTLPAANGVGIMRCGSGDTRVRAECYRTPAAILKGNLHSGCDTLCPLSVIRPTYSCYGKILSSPQTLALGSLKYPPTGRCPRYSSLHVADSRTQPLPVIAATLSFML
jgi:hypothetical protein